MFYFTINKKRWSLHLCVNMVVKTLYMSSYQKEEIVISALYTADIRKRFPKKRGCMSSLRPCLKLKSHLLVRAALYTAEIRNRFFKKKRLHVLSSSMPKAQFLP